MYVGTPSRSNSDSNIRYSGGISGNGKLSIRSEKMIAGWMSTAEEGLGSRNGCKGE